MSDSIRERIMQSLVKRFEDMVAGINDYSTTWTMVSRVPLNSSQIKEGNILCVMDTEESKVAEINFMRCSLVVITEFWYRIRTGDNAATEANRMMTDIQRAMRSDIYTTDIESSGLTLNIVESRNQLDIDSVSDRLINGLVYWQVQYRHSKDNPTLKI
jgi:hypothetical protein